MVDANSLEATLKNQQWVGGQTPTAADAEAFEALKGQDLSPETHPNVFAWFTLVFKFSDAIKKSWPAGGAAGKGGKKEGGKKGGKKDAKKEEKADDDLDLFGDDDDDGEAAKAAAKAAKDAAGKKKKKEVIAQSLVMFEVKPVDSDTNLDDLAQRIFKIEMAGLYWKTQYKKEPVAFGIFKLIIGVTVEDEKVSVDGLQEKIEEFEDMVQSVEILAFNKI